MILHDRYKDRYNRDKLEKAGTTREVHTSTIQIHYFRRLGTEKQIEDETIMCLQLEQEETSNTHQMKLIPYATMRFSVFVAS